MVTDEQIIELFFARSEDAIRELDIKYGSVCRRLAYNILGNTFDAEECVNDAYLAVWNAIPPAKPHPLLTFLCKILRNRSLNLFYRQRAEKRISTGQIALSEIEDTLSSPASPEDELNAKELSCLLERFLDGLTKENRVIFVLRYGCFESCAEIARHMGMTEKNASVRLSRLRQKLKHYLKERDIFV